MATDSQQPDTLGTLLTELIWLDQRAKKRGLRLFSMRLAEPIRKLSDDAALLGPSAQLPADYQLPTEKP